MVYGEQRLLRTYFEFDSEGRDERHQWFYLENSYRVHLHRIFSWGSFQGTIARWWIKRQPHPPKEFSIVTFTIGCPFILVGKGVFLFINKQLCLEGSAKGKPGPAGIWGVLRDDKGCVLAIFVASIGIRGSNEAEFLAIVKALEMSLEKEWLKEGSLIVESDSKVALAWIKSSSP